MGVVGGLIVATGLVVAIVYLGVQMARSPDDGDVPRRRSTWLGPDAVAITSMVADALADVRTKKGLDEFLCGDTTDRLAAHHAFDMAARNFANEEDPEGEDLGGRRHRMHPGFVGRLHEIDLILTPEGPSTEESLLADLSATAAWEEALSSVTDPTWNALGVAVVVEEGRCALCLVLGAWWADVDRIRLGEAGIGGWRLDGRVAPGGDVAALSARLADGEIVAATPHEDPVLNPRTFSLVLPWEGDANGLRATVLHNGEPGLIQVLR
jgi:hypothetical protein